MKPKCPYCGDEAELVTGAVVYHRRPDLDHKLFWRCVPCNAYVGCHPGTSNPLGGLANAELRQWKQNAHRWFDPIWDTKKGRSHNKRRGNAYQWLATKLGIPLEQCHIGMFDVATCRRVVEVCMARQKGKVA